jgi:hypothetical protein
MIKESQILKKGFTLKESYPHYKGYAAKISRSKEICIDIKTEMFDRDIPAEPEVYIIEDGGIAMDVPGCKTIADLDTLIKLFS